MNQEDILSGKAGVAGIQRVLSGQSSRRLLRSEAQNMLRPGYRVGPLHLTRAKFKPGRKLLSYFNFPALDDAGEARQSVHLVVSWQKDLDAANHADDRDQLQEEADRFGLMPVQRKLWRNIPDQGPSLQIWPLDPEFPHLVRLGNPSNARGMFASLGIAHDLKQLPVITPIRYRPGERHVLRYDLPSPETDSGKGQRLYAKLYSHPQDAVRAFGVANRVVDWLEANNQGIQGNRPQAISEEDSVIFYPHAPGIPLSHQLHRSPRWLAAHLTVIGGVLATLHSGPKILQADLKQNSFTREVKVVKRASEHIQILLPETHDKILEILDKLEGRYSNLPQEEPTFTHSDFKSDHLLTTPYGLTLIDFDTCTLTDPALDIGKFLADLEWWFALKGISGAEDAQTEVVRGYVSAGRSEHTLHERLARARLFHVLILVKIVARRVPIYAKDWAAMTARLINRADQVLHKLINV